VPCDDAVLQQPDRQPVNNSAQKPLLTTLPEKHEKQALLPRMRCTMRRARLDLARHMVLRKTLPVDNQRVEFLHGKSGALDPIWQAIWQAIICLRAKLFFG